MKILKSIRNRDVPVTIALATSIGLLMGVMLIIVQVLHFWSNETNTRELLREKAWGIVTEIEHGVRNHLDPAANMVDRMSREIVPNGTVIPQSRMWDLFSGAMIALDCSGSINFFYPDYTAYGVIPGNNRKPVLSPVSGRMGGKGNPDLARLMQDSRAANRTFWNQPEFFRDQSFVVVTSPVWANSTFQGFMAATVEVRSLSQLMARLGKRFRGTPFIMRGKDHVLAHPSLVWTHLSQSEKNPIPTLAQLGDSVLSRIWDAEPMGDVMPDMKMRGFSFSIARIDGDEYMFLSKTLRGYGKEPYTVGAWFHAGHLSTQLMRLFNTMLAGLALLVVGVLLAVLLGRRIARPVRKAAKTASAVSSFDLDSVEQLKPSYFRELNEQMRAFNSMIGALKAFSFYVPKKLVSRLIRENLALGSLSQERELTVMFTDIVGFTSRSETLAAVEVANQLNQHFELLGSQVEAQGGTIDKFIGDALMAFWGAPEILADSPDRACAAALAIKQAVEADNAEHRKNGVQPVRIRIGIHTGRVVVGNIGSRDRINYTIVGDAVNVTQRLESMGREHRKSEDEVTILISEDTRSRLTDSFVTRSLGMLKVKGREQPLEVHKLIGFSE